MGRNTVNRTSQKCIQKIGSIIVALIAVNYYSFGQVYLSSGENLPSISDSYKQAASEARISAAATLCSDRKKYLLQMAAKFDCMVKSQNCDHLEPQGPIPSCPADGGTGGTSANKNNAQTQSQTSQQVAPNNGSLMDVAGVLGSQMMKAKDPKMAAEAENAAMLTEQLTGQGADGKLAGNAVRIIGGISTLFGKKKEEKQSTRPKSEERVEQKSSEAEQLVEKGKAVPLQSQEVEEKVATKEIVPSTQNRQLTSQSQELKDDEQDEILARMKKRVEEYNQQQTKAQISSQISKKDQFTVDSTNTTLAYSPTKEVLLLRSYPDQTIPATISYESNQIINYRNRDGSSASINKNELVAILYPDGHRTIFRSENELNAFLQGNDPFINQWKTQFQNTNLNPAEVSPTVSSLPTLSDLQYKEYRQKALDQLAEFVRYLTIVTNKNISPEEKDKAIDEALKLFLPDAIMEVNSLNRPGARQLKIREYLTRLKLLPYSSVKIEWNEVNYVQELTQASDGNYYGIISGQQKFVGYGADGRNIKYQDVTQKNAKVMLQSYQKSVEGQTQLGWTVLLGNIGVVVQ